MKRISALLVFLAMTSFLLIVGCASSRLSNRELLQTEYSQMSDQELLEYYQQLEGRISGRDSGGGLGFGLGVGMGYGFDGGAVGLGASKGPDVDAPVEALQARRNQVRLELDRRGLEPLPTED